MIGDEDSLDLRQLRYFLAVAETGGYSKAAQRHNITQQAVSAAVSKLERSLNTKLCERDQSGTRLTDAGKALTDRARVLLADSQNVYREISAIGRGELGAIRIGVADDPAGGFVPRTLLAFAKEHPDVEISIGFGLNRILRDQLIEGSLDLVVAAPFRPWQSDRDLIVEELYETRLELICSNDHPVLERDEIHLVDLQDYHWMVPSPPATVHENVLRAYRMRNLEPPTNFLFCDNPVVGIGLMVTSTMIIPAHQGTVQTLLDNKTLAHIPVNIDFGYRTACLAFRRNAIHNDATQKFIAAMQESACQMNEGAR